MLRALCAAAISAALSSSAAAAIIEVTAYTGWYDTGKWEYGCGGECVPGHPDTGPLRLTYDTTVADADPDPMRVLMPGAITSFRLDVFQQDRPDLLFVLRDQGASDVEVLVNDLGAAYPSDECASGYAVGDRSLRFRVEVSEVGAGLGDGWLWFNTYRMQSCQADDWHVSYWTSRFQGDWPTTYMAVSGGGLGHRSEPDWASNISARVVPAPAAALLLLAGLVPLLGAAARQRDQDDARAGPRIGSVERHPG